MAYFSEIWRIEVRDEIAAEFTFPDGTVDDNLAGLHEARARLAEREERQRLVGRAAQPDDIRAALQAEGWVLFPKDRNRPAA